MNKFETTSNTRWLTLKSTVGRANNILRGDKQNSLQPLKMEVKENMKGRTEVRRAEAKKEAMVSNQYEGDKAVITLASNVKLSEFPGKNEVSNEDGRPLEESSTEEKICLGSVVSSWYITFSTLNINEKLLINNFTESNSRIGLCRKVWTARY